MSSVQISKFYQTPSDVKTYNVTRSPLPDVVLDRIISEFRKTRQTEKHGKFDLMIDVGCGRGRHMKLFAPHFKKIIAFDVTELQIQEARVLNPFDNVTYMVGSGEDMPVKDKSVDFAAFIFSPYFMDIEKVEKELLRVLKPDGVALMYGDLVDGIELLDANGSVVEFSELSRKPIDLWNNFCMKPAYEFAVERKAPDQRIMDRFEAIFNDIHQFQKKKINFPYHEAVTLEELIGYHYPGIPLLTKFADLQKQNPFHLFAQELKKSWNLLHVENKDINLKLTRGSFTIMLERVFS